MFAKQYSHRLPANYDMGIIRRRAAELGPLWDATEGLQFKAFIARERGVLGASDNQYASVYLWKSPAGAADFLTGVGFQRVIDSFGRPHVEAWLPLAIQPGQASTARSLYREELPLGPDADRQQRLNEETERNHTIAQREDTFAVFLALDVGGWRLIRITLSALEADVSQTGQAYEVLYLAQPNPS